MTLKTHFFYHNLGMESTMSQKVILSLIIITIKSLYKIINLYNDFK